MALQQIVIDGNTYNLMAVPNEPSEPIQGNTEWEIQSYRNKTNNEIFVLASVWNNSLYRDGFRDFTGGFKDRQDTFEIHSVLRKSDGEVFTVGDRFSDNTAGQYTEHNITKIEVEGSSLKLFYDETGAYYELHPGLKKLPSTTPQSQSVNNTEVKVDVFNVSDLKDFNTYMYQVISGKDIPTDKIRQAIQNVINGTQERLYTAPKKPIDERDCLSINDIKECYTNPHGSPLFNEFISNIYRKIITKNVQ